MCLGALVDAGAPMEEIKKNLKKLNISGYSLTGKKVKRAGITATKVDVVLKTKAGKLSPSATISPRRIRLSSGQGMKSEARNWRDIQEIIKNSSLPEHIKKRGHEIFLNLFKAEAKVHGNSIHKTHLHELGCTDCIVDIFGTLIGLELLGIKKVYSSPVNLGKGFVRTEHGIMPVPAPATAELLKNYPIYSSDIPYELTTPTGAAILKSISAGFGAMPILIPDKIGNGAGSRNFKNSPNTLRIFIGDNARERQTEKSITVIETNIDDMNPQLYEYVFERLFMKGALDVYLTQIMMKKTRPGIKLSVLCNTDTRDKLIDLLFKETSSIGVRYYETQRKTMDRESRDIKTEHGKVRVKISRFGKSAKNYAPEYEDCKKIALKTNLPLIDIIDEAKKAAMKTPRRRNSGVS
ncbi:MAG: TIGR00299 family protein [Nitrospirae bacterium GWC2_42_7]|nr:MAG: TIGR00299 family protein [Nitrospirae bacterium GWC2_42_7]